MLNFDENGYLTPHAAVESNLVEMRETLIFTAHRRRLFDQYLAFVADLQRLDIGNFTQWIDGSFVSRKPYPNDIDLVTFVDFDVYRRKGSRILDLGRLYSDIDCYFEVVYSARHPLFDKNGWERAHWMNVYGKTSPNAFQKRIKKGFIQLKF